MVSFDNLKPRVSTTHSHHGAFVVQIAPYWGRGDFILCFAISTSMFAFFLYIFVTAFMRLGFTSGAIYLLPFLAAILAVYIFLSRMAIWRSFGTERIVIDNGVLHWTRTALFWVRQVEIPTNEVASVRAVTSFHSLNNRVELTLRGRRRIVGTTLLKGETEELANGLRQAIGLVRNPRSRTES